MRSEYTNFVNHISPLPHGAEFLRARPCKLWQHFIQVVASNSQELVRRALRLILKSPGFQGVWRLAVEVAGSLRRSYDRFAGRRMVTVRVVSFRKKASSCATRCLTVKTSDPEPLRRKFSVPYSSGLLELYILDPD